MIIVNSIVIILIFGIMLGAALLVIRNYRLGKGDRRGALRLCWFVIACWSSMWILTARHVSILPYEFSLFFDGVRSTLMVSLIVWALYIAIEPYVRRRWPSSLVTWNRVLAGKFRDPIVGRDILIGLLGVTFLRLIDFLIIIIDTNLSPVPMRQLPSLFPYIFDGYWLPGAGFIIANVLEICVLSVIIALSVGLVLTLLRALLRRMWLVTIVIWLLIAVVNTPYALGEYMGITSRTLIIIRLIQLMILISTPLFIFIRYGLLSSAVFIFTMILPITTNFSTWYASSSLFGMLLLLALTVFAFYTSVGGQKVFTGKLLEE